METGSSGNTDAIEPSSVHVTLYGTRGDSGRRLLFVTNDHSPKFQPLQVSVDRSPATVCFFPVCDIGNLIHHVNSRGEQKGNRICICILCVLSRCFLYSVFVCWISFPNQRMVNVSALLLTSISRILKPLSPASIFSMTMML